jgi:multidrug efflux pump subunit AcrB
MWIVRLALRRPYTFVVAAMLVAILGGVIIVTQMATDIFPSVNIPVIAVAFNYTGMSPEDMDRFIIAPYGRLLTTTVNDIDHFESQSLYGIGIIKIYFHENAKIEEATAQVTAVSQTAIRMMPTGTQPPLIVRYDASDVPILQLSIGSETMPEQQLFDQAVNFLRPKLVTVKGVQIPFPYGGKQRQMMVDLDPAKLAAYGISPNDVSAAINAQNLILPAGTAKISTQEYEVRLNSSPDLITDLNDVPIKSVNGIPIFIRDVAHVRDGFIVQTNVVHSDGKRGVLMSILKSGGASTISVVNDIKSSLPAIKETLSKELKISPMFDQSLFVKAAVWGVVKEGAIAAGLTAMMILLFLGSWRSTLIVMISIPLSILVSIIVLYFLGETLNVMTLGGMALAVGILVDDATVEIENIHRNLHMHKKLVVAILDGASQIAVPAFVSTLCICIVFVPVVFISGAAKYLFTPMAMAVVFAMLTSYLLSRTLVPTMVRYLLASEIERYGGVRDPFDPHIEMHADARQKRLIRIWVVISVIVIAVVVAMLASPLGAPFPFVHDHLFAAGKWMFGDVRFVAEVLLAAGAIAAFLWLNHRLDWLERGHQFFDKEFEKLRRVYGGFLAWTLEHRGVVTAAFAFIVAATCLLFFVIAPIGTDFFPSVDAGQVRLHVRCPPGTRIEQSEAYFAEVEDSIRGIIPAKDITVILDNIGIPNSAINLCLSDGSLMSPADGEILISLNEGHAPTDKYLRAMRKELPKKFHDLTFFFAPSDIVTQVLNFGLQSPIDVRFSVGKPGDVDANYALAQQFLHDVTALPGVVDVRMQQVPRTPDIKVNVDRTLASEVGVTQQNVASDLLVSLSSSNQTAPNFFVNKQNGVNYSIYVQTPQYWMGTMNELENTPVPLENGSSTPDNTQLLSNLATVDRGVTPSNITRADISNTFDVLLAVSGKDLGSTAKEIQKLIDQYTKKLPAASKITMAGQIQSMNDSFTGLGFGLIFAVVLVYLLMVINFQSWMDPLIILMALPGAMAGILWMLWATQTTISVPALMGAIMSIGVATANSILMITFANDQRKEGMNAHDAALSAGLTRLRPVIMTALAMIIGMLPMSLGLGEGGEENAPLGRAVIGGLAMATVSTLIFVPIVYSALRTRQPQTEVEPELQA